MPPQNSMHRCPPAPLRRRSGLGLALLLSLSAWDGASAADLSPQRVAPLFTASGLSAEVTGGYLTGMSRELVYNIPGDGSKLSQLNWQIDRAFVLGGSLNYQALDWLTLRGRGWTHLSSDNAMDDYDWLFGYRGFESWSDWSHHGDTRLAKAYQIDLGASARLMETGPWSVSALAGYRFLTMKWDAYGGSYIYSTNGFRDDIGSFEAGELQIAYQQWWHIPYLGLGFRYGSGPLTVTAELIGSPLVGVRDKDNHVDIALFKEAFSPTVMAGASLGAELAVTDRISLTWRAEAQRFFEAKGGTKEFDLDPPGFDRAPKPSAGADHQSLLVSFGIKGRL